MGLWTHIGITTRFQFARDQKTMFVMNANETHEAHDIAY